MKQSSSLFQRPALHAAMIGLAMAIAAGSSLASAAQPEGQAQDSSGNTSINDYPPALLQIMATGNVKVVREFKTDLSGVTGYVLHEAGKSNDNDAIVYGDRGFMIAGQIFGKDGTNLTKEYRQKYVPKTDLSSVVKKIEKTGQPVVQGPSGVPVLYAFIDPNCIFCHRFYQSVEPLIKQGRIQVRWVLVGFLAQSSMGRAAAILSAQNPLAAIKKNESDFSESPEHGGIAPKDDVSDHLRGLIQANTALMNAAGGDGTPTLLYKEGQSWHKKVGAPPASWLNQYAAPAKPAKKKSGATSGGAPK